MSYWINIWKCVNCGTEIIVPGGMVGTTWMGRAINKCTKESCGNTDVQNFVNLGPMKTPEIVYKVVDSVEIIALKAKLEVAESLLDAYIKNEKETEKLLNETVNRLKLTNEAFKTALDGLKRCAGMRQGERCFEWSNTSEDAREIARQALKELKKMDVIK